jgi:ATP-dependent DNA helicase DinG
LSKKYIRTINYNNYKGLFIEYSLLNIWDFLYNNLWSQLDSCVLTSATLSVNSNFDYISNILKLDNFDFSSLKSDFDYKNQSLLYIPNDLGSIKSNLESIVLFLKYFILIVWGRTLVLFTALSLIKQIYPDLSWELKKNNINLYAQWIWLWSNKILDFYKKNNKESVIFWTDTFWEWIDIPWEDLKYLIIYKIPFMVPSDPIFKARSVLFKDSFNDYSIPKSIIKLRQWFWRLIRTNTDSGIVIFLDNRIINTSWWKKLVKAFPEDIKLKIWSSEKLFDVLKSGKKTKD